MSSYGFSIRIAASDLQQLIKGGYVFAASKSVGASAGGQNVQWITSPLLAPNLTVSWTENYSLYFTNTAIVNGAQISQDNTAPVVTGRAYKYENATFQEDPTHAPVSAGSIAITNNEPVAANYGLSQSASVGATSLNEPLIIVNLYQNGGSCTFTPSETVTIGFSNTYINPGVVAQVQTSTYTFNLKSGSNPTFSYDNGVWSQLPSASLETSLKVGEKFWKYVIGLSATVAFGAFEWWIKSKIQSGYTVKVTRTQSETSYEVTVQGNVDPTRTIEALKGQEVNDTKKKFFVDRVEITTVLAKVTSVTEEELSLAETLWNYLASTKH